MALITNTITEQFEHEIRSWRRLLEFFVLENSFLKTRLSEVVDQNNENSLINKAEYFHNEFLWKDDCFRDVLFDIQQQEKKIQVLQHNGNLPDAPTVKKQDRLRNEITYLEKAFALLKKSFNEYLLSLID